jgi:pentatricopeptide repeat protein
LLEILADGSAASCEQALRVLGDMCDRAEEMGAPYAEDGTSRSPLNTEYDDFKIDKDRKALRPEILPVSLTASGRRILAAQYSPDQTTFALVIEACVACRQPSKALEAFAQMERWGLRPDRRVYAALIQAFGINGGSGGDERVRDVASALGVFDEMRKNFAPDVGETERFQNESEYNIDFII